MKRESGQTDHPDDLSTWSHSLPPSDTKGAQGSTPSDSDATIPVSGTGDDQETRKVSKREPLDDSGESTPISSLGSGSGEATARDWDAVPPPIFEPGNTVFGKYKLIEMLGEGGMGQVWLVENIQLDCKSALKLIRPEIAKSDKAWKRFKREAQVMAKLNHPNAVAVRDFARAQSVAYIEMEYVRGRSLDKLIEEHKGKPFPIEWIAPIVDQLCSVLQEAHDHVDEKTGKPRPIIHRDLKPSNLMLVDRKSPGSDLKVLDFGIAKMADDDRESNLTGDAEFVGTAAYSSPEQIRTEAIDGRSDIYSCGIILYQFLTGELPFQGGPRRAIVAHLMEPPRPFAQANPAAKVSPRVEALVLQCLEKDVELRPRSARELSERFRAAIGATAGHVGATQSGTSSFLKPAIAMAVVLAAVVIGGVYVATRTSGPSPDAGKVADQPNTGTDVASKDPVKDGAPTETKTPVPPPQKPRWVIPEGFRTAGDDTPDGPKTIERLAGRVLFDRQESGIYLPRGFVVSESDAKEGEWPLWISLGTNAGAARFRFIKGGRFQMGNMTSDENTESPGLDTQDKPILPHWVQLSAFYIQETEVTNGQIQAFLKEKPGALSEEKLKGWDRQRELVAKNLDAANSVVSTYPAVSLDWDTANRFAESIGGLLPTEAQWEYAARSQGLPKRFATKGILRSHEKPRANLFYGNDNFLMPVKRFEKDVTDQGIFDMTGNVREWCRDGYQPHSAIIGASAKMDSALVDPCMTVVGAAAEPNYLLRVGPSVVNDSDFVEGAKYLVRGGSFQTEPDHAWNVQRDADFGKESVSDLGFRVVVELPTVSAAP